ncbi:MAG TPA: Crp/Fnr family transcriptional regulator [Terriglobales bacterium]|nr:Crp/Fnr family transcriptional regulator [Terriglobales bacterium]
MPAESPYGLPIIDSCVTCKSREDFLFCSLSRTALENLQKIKSSATYPKGAVLFVEGQNARGIFILCSGRAKLSTSAADGRSLILRIAEPGEVLGLSASVSGRPYEVTAETLGPAQANFVERNNFLHFLKENGEVALRVAQELSNNYYSAYTEIRSLGLSHTSSEKLAKLLLEWSENAETKGLEQRVKVTLTHEEIAQLIGSSRETVTRSFTELKKKQLIQLKGSTLVIRNRAALEKLVNS